MINKNELRLGNLVNLRGHITEIQALKSDRCMALDDFAEYNDLEPIALDEKKLIELGFVLTEVKRNKFIQTNQERIDKIYELYPYDFDDRENIKVEVIKDRNDLQIRRIGILGTDNYELISIDKVHKFQNICYFMYNQELTIK